MPKKPKNYDPSLVQTIFTFYFDRYYTYIFEWLFDMLFIVRPFKKKKKKKCRKHNVGNNNNQKMEALDPNH